MEVMCGLSDEGSSEINEQEDEKESALIEK